MRKIIDDRGRLFGLISFIDVIVAVVVIVLALAVFVKFRTGDGSLMTANTDDITFSVKIYSIRETNVNHLRVGDRVYLTDLDSYVGTIVDVVVEDAYTIEPILDGTYVKGRIHERYDVTLYISAQCSASNGRYYIDRTHELNMNSQVWLNTKYNYVIGTVMSITAD